MSSARRRSSAFAALALLGILFPFAAAAPVAAADPPATVPSGFQDRLVWSGLSNPTAVAFTADGSRVFVAEKNGRIKEFNGLTDTSSTTVADLSPDVHNYWDRGLLGLAVDPKFTTGRPYLYALYAYNHVLGASGDGPHWPDRRPQRHLPDAAGAAIRRLRDLGPSRSPHRRPGRPVGLGDQAPHHRLVPAVPEPLDRLAGLRAEGALYVSGGDGASFNEADYGQLGDSPGRRHRSTRAAIRAPNPPPRGRRAAVAGPADERRPDQPRWRGPADRPRYRRCLARQRQRRQQRRERRADHRRWPPQPVPVHGPPGTGRSGSGTSATATGRSSTGSPTRTPRPRNFGWPCYEGNGPQPELPGLGPADLQRPRRRSTCLPYFTYNHASEVVGGDGCPHRQLGHHRARVPPRPAPYPDAIDGALFFTDWARRCIWSPPAGSTADPTSGTSSCSRTSIRPTRPTAAPSSWRSRPPATYLHRLRPRRGPHDHSTGNVRSRSSPRRRHRASRRSTVKFNASGPDRPERPDADLRLGPRRRRLVRRLDRETPSKTYTASGSSGRPQGHRPAGHSDTSTTRSPRARAAGRRHRCAVDR